MNDFAKEIASKIPTEQIYVDGLQPSARQIGLIGEDLIKVLHLVLAPIQLVAALQDRYRDFIDKSVRKIPIENRVTPPAQILGPILEGIRYEPAGTEVDEISSNLLSTAMDKENIQKAHPSYPKIITQLSRDEVVILKFLVVSEPYRIYEADLTIRENDLGFPVSMFSNFRDIEDTFPRDKLFFPQNKAFYISHLFHLGLAAIYKQAEKPIEMNGMQTGTTGKEVFRLTDFGRAFSEACGLLSKLD